MGEKHTIVLADGTKLENLELNGNNYVSEAPVSAELLTEENLAGVTIDGTVHEQMVLDALQEFEDKTWIVVRDITEAEKELKATKEELNMMKECLLEMSEAVYA